MLKKKSDDVGGKAQVRMTRGKVSAAPNDLKAGVVKESSGKVTCPCDVRLSGLTNLVI